MTKMLRKQLEKLEQSKENCKIFLDRELVFFGKIWRIDGESIELITFSKEDAAEDLATSGKLIVPIDLIIALGYGWHTLRNREQSLVSASIDLQPFKNG